ncbi:MAG: hypothetical protein AMXMBFR79_00230 [Chitinophagaceae bacterium]
MGKTLKFYIFPFLNRFNIGMTNQEKRKRSYVLMRTIYDMGMAVFLLGMAVFMLFGSIWGIDKFLSIDKTFRYLFGAICLLYGAFRLYRGLKRDY